MIFPMKYVTAACVLISAAPLATAQKVPKNVEFSGTPKCADCGVRLQEITTLGALVVGSARLEIDAYSYDRKRKLAYIRGASRTEVDAYGLDGKLQFTVGFHDRYPPVGARDNAFAVGPGDSLWVLDPSQQHVAVYTPGTATAARSFKVKTHIERIIPTKDGQFVGVSSKPGDAPDHVLVHVFSADGKSMQPMGAPATAGSIRPAVGLSRDAGKVWIGRPDSYTIELWGIDGKQYSTVRRTVAWFTAAAVAKAKRDHRSPPAIVNIFEDDFGFLWVSGQKPDPTFVRRPAKSDAPPASDLLNVLEVLNVPDQKIEFADEIGLPLYRLGADYFVEPNIKGRIAAWRVVKVSIVKR
jgi:hypothetical protein